MKIRYVQTKLSEEEFVRVKKAAIDLKITVENLIRIALRNIIEENKSERT